MGHGREFDSDIKEPLKRGDFYWPAMPEPDAMDLKSQPYPTQEFVGDWLLRTCEIIDGYQPSLLYFDWWVQHEAFREAFCKMAAYYYNRGNEWGREVGICYKYDAMAFGCGIVEVERGGDERGCAISVADRYSDCEQLMVLYRYAGVQNKQADYLQFN